MNTPTTLHVISKGVFFLVDYWAWHGQTIFSLLSLLKVIEKLIALIIRVILSFNQNILNLLKMGIQPRPMNKFFRLARQPTCNCSLGKNKADWYDSNLKAFNK